MNLKNLKIRTQFRIGFFFLFFFVMILGIVTYQQSHLISQQTENMYEHPLRVRGAISQLRKDIHAIENNMNDILYTTDGPTIANDLAQIETFKADALNQIGILELKYLGSISDIDSIRKALISWNSMHDETIRALHTAQLHEVVIPPKTATISKKQLGELILKIQKVEDFAKKKANELLDASLELASSLNRQLIYLIAVILLLSLLINYILMSNIRIPMKELTDTAQRFHKGDMNARSSYRSQNEFGVLSNSFNTLAESIQANEELNKKAVNLTAVMLGEEEANEFFRKTLTALSAHTGSQMASVYLLSDDKKHYNHFESIGVDENARRSFTSETLEGEFGAVLSTHNLQHIKNIPRDTRFVFNTVGGKFIPREIITIPILAGSEVIAIISLASINIYNIHSIELVENILDILSARVEGILAYFKIKEFSEKLVEQNHELEAKKTELGTQSTELMSQNTELEMQKKQLDEASRLKTVFLSNMSHELRTPLNSVIALSGVLNRRLAKKIPEEEHNYLEVIERNGKHLLSLINDVLDIARIEAGREEIELTKFDAGSIITEVIDMIQPQAEEKNIELLNIEKETNLTITSDANKLRHIMQNLISNAVKFTEKGKVAITAKHSANMIEIIITDTGIGIPESELPHIFDEFRQADSSTSRKYGGTGLGLAIAKKYANLLGGIITVKSILEKGSEFIVKLPVIHSHENRIIETAYKNSKIAPYEGVNRSSLKTILLVEDSEPANIQVKDILDEAGYQIIVAHDGSEALEITAKTIPDAMILDLMMSGIDGFEVLKIIHESERTAHIPVLILTAKDISKDDLKYLKRNNIHQLIQKGDMKRGELINAIAGMITPNEVIIKPQRKSQPIEGKAVVMVVEDNPDNMLTVKALLSENYVVIEAVNGIEGLELAKKYEPNLILLDIALPVMDGIEVFKKIRALPKLQDIAVIALTASAMTNDREAILAYGFDGYIPKPIDESVFFKAIDEILYGK